MNAKIVHDSVRIMIMNSLLFCPSAFRQNIHGRFSTRDNWVCVTSVSNVTLV